MTVGELKNSLDIFDDNTPILLALQPSYPMLGKIINVCDWKDVGKSKETGNVCLIACSDTLDYGCPHKAWEEDEISYEE